MVDIDSTNEEVQLELTKQLFQHATPSILSTIVNALIVFIVFRDIIDPRINISWMSLTVSNLLIKLYFIQFILNKGISSENFLLRLKQFCLLNALSGLIFGSAGILYLSSGRPAYNAFIYFLMGGMFAGSMGAYGIHKWVYFSFSLPIILPVTIYSFILGGELNVAMATMGVIFILLMIFLVLRMNITIVAAVKLGVDNTFLAKDAERLNAELKLSNQMFQELSYRDSLTQIHNRHYINEVLNNELYRFAFSLIPPHPCNRLSPDNDESVYGVFIIDIDHFKDVNDKWGHNCGDKLLVQFVGVLKTLIRKDDALIRWGGEEFVIVLKKSNPEYLHLFAQMVIDSIESASFNLSDDIRIKKTCSLGYTAYPFIRELPQSLSLEQTIEIADQALYYAKKNGRNRAIKAAYNFSEKSHVSLEDLDSIFKDLPHAIEEKKITLMQSPS